MLSMCPMYLWAAMPKPASPPINFAAQRETFCLDQIVIIRLEPHFVLSVMSQPLVLF